MTAPEEPGTEPRDGTPDQDGSDERPVLTTDEEAQTDDPVISPESS
ncbi:MAG: hypothetical protein H0V10_12635 [Geodermatophilaceae bacterium]|nr:hypothetical protein [Geodermatophilaceae bacterium]